MIRGNHPDLKGSFTCLGNWYNLFNKESMNKLNDLLIRYGNNTPIDKFNQFVGRKLNANSSDLLTAQVEIANAQKNAEFWVRHPSLGFLYDTANAQGDWDTTF